MKKRFFPSLILLILIASCVSRIEKRGYIIDSSDHALIEKGVTSKEKLFRIMGSPTLINDLETEESWIYFSEEVEHFMFFQPKIIARDIIVLTFDDKGFVANIKKLNLKNENKKFQFAKEETQIDDHKNSWVKSIINNVGQIKAQ